jgi:hypothetical protein
VPFIHPLLPKSYGLSGGMGWLYELGVRVFHSVCVSLALLSVPVKLMLRVVSSAGMFNKYNDQRLLDMETNPNILWNFE